MKLHYLVHAAIILSGLLTSHVFAQDNTRDYCATHPEMFDTNGRLTLDAHKKLHLSGPEWWFDSSTREWKEWPTKKTTHTLQEHKDMYVSGPEWWFDSSVKEWKTMPKRDHHESFDCHKKLYHSGPEWWFDSSQNEWKRWPR